KQDPKMKGLILDLRNNPGGILEDAVQIVNYFVPKGETVLSTRGKVKNWDRTYKTTQEPIDAQIPLAVMVNRGSASASEIVAGALQDLDRAVIIGERTFGKGLVQTTRPVSYNGMIKVTTAKYYIPSGRLIQAIDYSNRNPDGSVGRIPDSLTQVFFTANKRPVRDGGGIQPDFPVENQQVSNLLIYLMRDMMFFDFANEYAATHESIGDIQNFKLTDKDYKQFKEFVKSKDFTYDRQSDKALQELKKIAEFEGYSDQAKAEFEALEAKFNHNIDRDMDTFRPEIEQMLTQEIARRYYFQKGEIIQTLKKDAELDKAIEVVGNPAEYRKTLHMQEQK
ncbi:MAG: S41 family peptidase, partial [Bacteroidales bacterium]